MCWTHPHRLCAQTNTYVSHSHTASNLCADIMAEVVIALSLGLTMFVNVAMLKIQDLRDVVDVVYDDSFEYLYSNN